MHLSVYIPVIVSILVAIGSPRVARRLAPRPAAMVLTASAGAIAVSSIWAALLLALPKLLQEPAVALGELRVPTLAALDPVPHVWSLAGGLMVVFAVVSGALAFVRRRRQLLELEGLSRRAKVAGDLLLLAVDQPVALALPGRRGSVLLSRGLLRALTNDERKVILAHERAHIRCRHDRYRFACTLAAAVNPLLRGIRRDVDFALERWADEVAARTVSSRSLVARALARTALLAGGQAPQAGTLAFERLSVSERVLALNDAPPRPHLGTVVACAALAVIGVVAAADATFALGHILMAAHS